MKRFKRILVSALATTIIVSSPPSHADMFGGDVVVLMQDFLAQAIQQLIQLKQILTTGSDTLDLLKDINQGVGFGLAVIQMINPKFNPGLYGNLNTADQVLTVIEDLYGKIPQTRIETPRGSGSLRC